MKDVSKIVDRNQLINYVVKRIHYEFPKFVTAGHGPDSPITPMDEQAVPKEKIIDILTETLIIDDEEDLEQTHKYVERLI